MIRFGLHYAKFATIARYTPCLWFLSHFVAILQPDIQTAATRCKVENEQNGL